MGLLAVKAAEQRSKYIVDKYHYGIECSTCSYDYLYYAKLDFISDCEDICSEDVTITSLDSTLDCTNLSPTYVEPIFCSPNFEILDCNQQYTIRELQALESNAYLYSTVVTNSLSLIAEFDSAIVNGVEYLNGIRKVNINPSTVTTETIGSLTYITNFITALNNLNLPGLRFYPGETQKTMKVRYPVGTTWQITTTANNDTGEWVHGLIVDQDGLVSLDAFGGGHVAPPYGGSVGANFSAGYTTKFVGNLC